MCGRYYVDNDDPKFQKIVAAAIEKNKKKEYEQIHFKGGDLTPGMIVPVITNQGPTFMKWGFPSLLADKKAHINIRSENAANLKTFSQALKLYRCLIPASAYYEWQSNDAGKTAYLFNLPDNKLFYMAALASCPDDNFAIMTRAATDEIAFIHQRMPVIIPNHLLDDWLHHSPAAIQQAITYVENRIL